MPDKPNVVIIFNDDHAQWASGAYGNRELRTPSIDHLAGTGVLMENAFTPTPVLFSLSRLLSHRKSGLTARHP